MNNQIPPVIKIAVEFMRQSFGGTDVEIVSEAYRLSPSEDAPAGALGCDVHISIPGHKMKPVKIFLRNSIAEDIAFNNMGGAPGMAQMVADEIVFECIRPEFEKLNELKNNNLCYCGNPIDVSNPDCIEFRLCKEHAQDA